jgi:hypothetical protein
MKTPIQQAIEQIQAKSKYQTLQYQSACDDCIAILTALLPTEREVIEEAYDRGVDAGGFGVHGNAQHYFTTKFNNDGKTN